MASMTSPTTTDRPTIMTPPKLERKKKKFQTRLILMWTGVSMLLLLLIGVVIVAVSKPRLSENSVVLLSKDIGANDRKLPKSKKKQEEEGKEKNGVIIGQKSSVSKETVIQNDSTAGMIIDTDDNNDNNEDLESIDLNLLPRIIIGGVSYTMKDFISFNNNNTTNSSSSSSSLLLDGPSTIQEETLNVPLPTPIIVVGLPKAGTTSITDFFNQSGYNTTHFLCYDSPLIHCGLCIRDAVNKSLPPLQTCGQYTVWSQIDVEYPPDRCHFPQIVNLMEIHNEAPNATFILNRRNMTKWVHSVKNWSRRPMDERLAACDYGPKSNNVTDMIDWHIQHIYHIRQFVKNHPSHALVEFDIEEQTTTGILLATLFQSNASYWGHSNSNVATKNVTNVTSSINSTNSTNDGE